MQGKKQLFHSSWILGPSVGPSKPGRVLSPSLPYTLPVSQENPLKVKLLNPGKNGAITLFFVTLKKNLVQRTVDETFVRSSIAFGSHDAKAVKYECGCLATSSVG